MPYAIPPSTFSSLTFFINDFASSFEKLPGLMPLLTTPFRLTFY
jgi:hypothetical protein